MKDAGSLRERALRLLARREYSRAELSRKLSQGADKADDGLASDGAAHGELRDALLDELQQQGLLSDQRYAEQRALSRGKRLGNSRLANELRTKGVEDAIIAAALDAVGDETGRAREVWQRKFRGAAPASREEWARQARFLQARGFSPELIRKLLNDPEHFRNDD